VKPDADDLTPATMTPAEAMAALTSQHLLATAPDVRLNTALYRFWRSLLAPLYIVTAAIAAAHVTHRRVLNPPVAPNRRKGLLLRYQRRKERERTSA